MAEPDGCIELDSWGLREVVLALVFEPKVSLTVGSLLAAAAIGLARADVPFWPMVTGAGAGVLYLSTVAGYFLHGLGTAINNAAGSG